MPTSTRYLFCTEDSVTCVTKTRNDIFMLVEFFIKSCTVNINVRTNADATVKFPTDDTPWVHGAANLMREENGTKTAAVGDCRGKVYYYDWDGTYPENVTFTPTTMDTVNGLIQTADPDFYDWLTANGSLNKDIRGKARDAQSMWPGSYQE